MDRCTELCTKEATGTCNLCDALAERDRFWEFWLGGGLFVAGVRALQRWRVFGFLRRHPLLVCGALALLVTLLFPVSFPEWDRQVIPFLLARPLFFVAVGIGLLIGLPYVLYVLLWKVPKWQVAGVDNEKDRVTAESAFRQTLAQMLGGAALLGGLYFTAQTLWVSQQTLQLSQDGQITDRFTKAIEQLGKGTLAVRLGGIYALERIAKDSTEKDHWTVMEVLTAFVREHAPLQEQPEEEAARAGEVRENQPRSVPPTDIQAVITVLGRRLLTFGRGESEELNLRRTNLQGVNLYLADLQGADLFGASLQNAYLFGANLQGATLAVANLQGATLFVANLQGASLRGASLRGADLRGANLQGVRHLTQEQVNQACGDEHTKLPVGLTPPPSCPK
jgi:pentapeptide repeat protein